MFKESKVDFPDKCVLQSLNIAFIKANSADPDEIPVYKGLISHYQMMSSIK